jgi:hypothetical protein
MKKSNTNCGKKTSTTKAKPHTHTQSRQKKQNHANATKCEHMPRKRTKTAKQNKSIQKQTKQLNNTKQNAQFSW